MIIINRLSVEEGLPRPPLPRLLLPPPWHVTVSPAQLPVWWWLGGKVVSRLVCCWVFGVVGRYLTLYTCVKIVQHQNRILPTLVHVCLLVTIFP